MMRFGLLVIVVLAIAILPAQGEEHAPPPSKQKIKALVDRLVSPNPKPITEEEDPRVAPDLRLPPGFDREKQAPVLQAALGVGETWNSGVSHSHRAMGGQTIFPHHLERVVWLLP